MTDREQIRVFVDELGRTALQGRLGLRSASAITNAIRRGRLPAQWYPEAERLSAERGVPCRREFFGFRGAAS